MTLQKKRLAGMPIFVKALLLVLVSSATVTVIMSVQSSRLIHRMSEEQLLDHAHLATEGLAANAAGALRFGKHDKILAGFESLQAANAAVHILDSPTPLRLFAPCGICLRSRLRQLTC